VTIAAGGSGITGISPGPAFAILHNSCDRLANGNILITAPTKSASASTRIFEVTRAGKVVWEIILPVNNGSFRAQRLAPPPLVEPLP